MSPKVRVALCALLPLLAVGELVAAELQKRRVPTDQDWRAAATAASAARKPGDMILVAPRWAEPLGRKALGEVGKDLVDLKMAGRSDLDTVPRVLELSLRGHDDPQTKGWRLVDEKRFGPVSLRTLENPEPEKLVRDLVSELGPSVTVQRVSPDGKVDPCRWEQNASVRMPGLFQGPPTPKDRWLCAPWDPVWSYAGVTVITDLQYLPRRCIMMHPTEANMTIAYPPGPIGKKVVGYVGIHVFQERELNKPAVHARISIDGKEVAHTRHVDGDGWLRFEGSTAEQAGRSLPVKLETWVEGPSQFRVTCVAAELRE